MDHKAGSNSGIDYGLVTVFLLWIAFTVGLLLLWAIRAHAGTDHERTRPAETTVLPAPLQLEIYSA